MMDTLPEALLATCTQNRAIQTMVVVSVLLFLAVFVVILRFYVRTYVLHNSGYDDYLILASLLIGFIAFGFYFKLFASGMGKHIYCLSPQQIMDTAEWSLLAQIFISIDLGLTKISVCIFILRVIKNAQRKLTRFIWVLVSFVVATHIVQIVLFTIECRPIEAVWNPLIKGRCFSVHVTYMIAYLNFSLEAFADLVCTGIAIVVIQRLQMDIRTKLALCFLMGLGIFTAACVIASAITLRGVYEKDYSWEIVRPSMWAGIGAFVGIITASLPILRPLFQEIFKAVTGGFSRLWSKPQSCFHPTTRREDDRTLVLTANRDVERQDKHINETGSSFQTLQDPASPHLKGFTSTLDSA